jgi:hypothetical protein
VNRTNWVTGKLDIHTISDLSQDLLNLWDNNYPASVLKPCKAFQGVNLNPSAHWKIEKNVFQRLPLIQKLVDHFETLFPHLAIEQVWLLQKSKDGDGVQGWHQDMVERITNTIVINLGNEDNSRSVQQEQEATRAKRYSTYLSTSKNGGNEKWRKPNPVSSYLILDYSEK